MYFRSGFNIIQFIICLLKSNDAHNWHSWNCQHQWLVDRGVSPSFSLKNVSDFEFGRWKTISVFWNWLYEEVSQSLIIIFTSWCDQQDLSFVEISSITKCFQFSFMKRLRCIKRWKFDPDMSQFIHKKFHFVWKRKNEW